MVYALRHRPYDENEQYQFYFDNMELQPYDTIREALQAMEDLIEVEVFDYIDIHRARVDIAHQSKRGLGNLLYINIGTHPAIDSSKLKNCTLIADPEATASYLYWQGSENSIFEHNARMDSGVLSDEHGKFYIHPDYKKYVRKLIFP